MTIKLLIADRDTIMREGLKRILEDEEDIAVVDEAADGYEALAKVRSYDLDMIVSGLSMPGPHGIDLIRQFRRQAPDIPILVLTMYDEKLFAVEAITAGAYGYISKESASTELIMAIRQVASGRPYISIKVAELLVHSVMPDFRSAPHKRLSKREFEIFTLFVGGDSNAKIADQLHLSVKTISTHKQNILRKMCLGSVSDMIEYAISERIIEPPHAVQ